MSGVARRALLPALLAVLAFPSVAMGAHANDSWTTAHPIGLDVEDLRNNTGATPRTGDGGAIAEPLTPTGPGYCNNGQYSATTGIDMTHTIWWRVTGDGYPITIDTRGSDIDTVVAVYDGEPSSSTFVTCNDDIRGGSNPNLASEAVFNTNSGAFYYVQVGCATGCSRPEGVIDFIAFS